MKPSIENEKVKNTYQDDPLGREATLEEQLELFAEIIIDIFLQKKTPNEKEES